MATATKPETASKLERIEARLRPEQKSRIEYAASLLGTSLSDFLVQNADAAARRTIQEHESWKLEGRDRQVFVDALLHPPEPSSRLRAAAARYRKRMAAR